MKVYIRKNADNEIANHNFYTAFDGFKQMGFEIGYFKNIEELSNHKEDIIISYVNDVRTALSKHGVIAPEIDYPNELEPYLGRKVWKSKLSVIANNRKKYKRFNGLQDLR